MYLDSFTYIERLDLKQTYFHQNLLKIIFARVATDILGQRLNVPAAVTGVAVA